MAHAEMAALPVAVENEDPLRMEGALDALAHEPRGVGQRVAAAHLVHQREEHLLGVVGLAEEASIEPPTELRAEAEHHGRRAGEGQRDALPGHDVRHRPVGVGHDPRHQQREGKEDGHAQDVPRQQVLKAAADHDVHVEQPGPVMLRPWVSAGDYTRMRGRKCLAPGGRSRPTASRPAARSSRPGRR